MDDDVRDRSWLKTVRNKAVVKASGSIMTAVGAATDVVGFEERAKSMRLAMLTHSVHPNTTLREIFHEYVHR